MSFGTCYENVFDTIEKVAAQHKIELNVVEKNGIIYGSDTEGNRWRNKGLFKFIDSFVIDTSLISLKQLEQIHEYSKEIMSKPILTEVLDRYYRLKSIADSLVLDVIENNQFTNKTYPFDDLTDMNVHEEDLYELSLILEEDEDNVEMADIDSYPDGLFLEIIPDRISQLDKLCFHQDDYKEYLEYQDLVSQLEDKIDYSYDMDLKQLTITWINHVTTIGNVLNEEQAKKMYKDKLFDMIDEFLNPEKEFGEINKEDIQNEL
ncbi:hypothetical protein [Breznakia pachnodae]|uniref:Uncharacterized protein n=1 Tax=Breznakia pachnodae TaxID=265178 RepID=A0ABU0E3W9_9FIRM|nr:hypothetical protein [Breznakia pachnodae]MDQ0361587.1 hypothetical protein [Breznakia pachnodae]